MFDLGSTRFNCKCLWIRANGPHTLLVQPTQPPQYVYVYDERRIIIENLSSLLLVLVLLRLQISDRSPDRIFRQHGAVKLDRRKLQMGSDI